MEATLDNLEENNVTFGTLLAHVFDDANTTAEWRWKNVFVTPGVLRKTLDFWGSKAPKSTREVVHKWVKKYMGGVLGREAQAASETSFLRMAGRLIDASFAAAFGSSALTDVVEESCPTIVEAVESVILTQRQVATAEDPNKPQPKHDKHLGAIWTTINLLAARSQRNSYTRHVMGLYLYSTGATRQQISVMNRFNLSVSYATLAGKGNKRTHLADQGPSASDETSPGTPTEEPSRRRKRRQANGLGTLEHLSLQMRKLARTVALSQAIMVVYDNINMVWKVAEQIVGRTDSQENGTCATVIPLFNANKEDLRTLDVTERFLDAPPLQLADIAPNGPPDEFWTECMTHTVLRIAVHHGGPQLRAFRGELAKCVPTSPDKIELHWTDVHPLPAMNIDESSKTGNAELIEAVFKELGEDTSSPEFAATIKLIAGDQLSIARLRSVHAARAGNEGGATGLGWALFIPGLFHYKITAVIGLLNTHFGHVNHDLSNPASLAAHNTLLERKPIVLTSLPSFRVCRDLTFVSLYARVLHCLLLVSGHNNLDDFAENLTWEELETYARQVVDVYTDTRHVAALRHARQLKGPKFGDMVYENGILFFRDALILREFSDAIKSGDSGRVFAVLKRWALAYRGSGRSKYGYETMYFIYMMTHVWPKPIVKIVLDNVLVNPTGKPDAWHEVDLLQEHLNFWIKNYYQAHGSGASWEWLATIAPCIQVLRALATSVNGMFGAKQGDRHATPDLTNDVDALMTSIWENQVYTVCLCREFADDDPPAVDVMAAGAQSLTWGVHSPLKQFNEQMVTLRRRLRVQPLVDETTANSSGTSSANGTFPMSPNGSAPHAEVDEATDQNGDAEDRDAEPDVELLEDLAEGVSLALNLITAEDVDLEMDRDLDEDDFNADDGSDSEDELDDDFSDID
ncbi:hypothetical protein OF83DRAFT_1050951 [Amylostereum chailletii]|nr:hypothetical protein OF83DRAFT_1050951 [Amylostereum chailletii]